MLLVSLTSGLVGLTGALIAARRPPLPATADE
jgi:hypothetical protein